MTPNDIIKAATELAEWFENPDFADATETDLYRAEIIRSLIALVPKDGMMWTLMPVMEYDQIASYNHVYGNVVVRMARDGQWYILTLPGLPTTLFKEKT